MNPGKLDRRITIQHRQLSKDSAGGRVETWVDSAKVWAQVISQTANEAITADADRSTDDRQFRIRHMAGIASGTHRIFYQLRFYDITGIEQEGRRDFLLVSARAIQSLTHR